MFKKKIELLGHQGGIYSCKLWDSSFLFTSSADKFVALWDLKSGKQESFAIKCDEVAYHINIVNDDKLLIIASSKGRLYFIDLINKKEIKHEFFHDSPIYFSLENKITNELYVSDLNGNLSIWDLNDLKPKLKLPINCGKIRSMTLNDNGKLLLLCCQDGFIRVFDTKYFNEINSFYTHLGGCNTILIYNNIIYTAGKDAYIRLWKMNDLSIIKEIPAHNFAIYKLEILNFGKNLISISRDKSIKLWDVDNMSVINKIEFKNGGHNHSVNSSCKIDENHVVTVGDDKRIILWELN